MKITYGKSGVIFEAHNALGQTLQIYASHEAHQYAFPRIAERIRLWQARARAHILDQSEGGQAALRG